MTRARSLAFAAAVVALIALSIGMLAGGTAFPRVIPGLPDPGVLTRWGLPLAKLALDAGGVLTVGLLLAASTLLPSDKGMLGKSAIVYVQTASWTALVWAGGALLLLVFGTSENSAKPVGQLLNPAIVADYARQTSQGVAPTLVLLFALAIALFSRSAITSGAAGGLLVFALAALLPPALTGHASSSPNHALATSALSIHVLCLALWVGGLAVVSAQAIRGQPQLEIAATRFSKMALWCFIGVGASGLFGVVARLGAASDLWTSDYGVLIVAKIAAFVLLGYVGWWHRQRTLVSLEGGRPGAFTRLAGGEMLLMAATMGLAVALTRTEPPPVVVPTDRAFDLLGFFVPPPISLGNLVTLWWFDLLLAVVAAVLGGLYGAGVYQLLRRGDTWPWGRTASWFIGVAVLVIATQSGLARYARVMFDAHLIEHFTLSMIVPIFLVLGGPVTLALRVIPPATKRGDRGPREWLTTILRSQAVKVIAHPATAMVLLIASTYALYFTPLFESAMLERLGHIAMSLHFLLSGCLFFWVIIGNDPVPYRVSYAWRLLTLFVTMLFHGLLGIALTTMDTVIASDWYEQLSRPWGGTLLEVQRNGAAIAWGFGAIPTLIVVLAIAAQWYRDQAWENQRAARRSDRPSDDLAPP
ncbi:cytochrome c oxidase assembly protein [Nonomuraea sp. KM90]|uniref:cytochrome c oxidase assembly protein n=1 Tax=Nonomuraea sp. KM90 TaxID=3457428 RepID=UPI003FCDCF0A